MKNDSPVIHSPKTKKVYKNNSKLQNNFKTKSIFHDIIFDNFYIINKNKWR